MRLALYTPMLALWLVTAPWNAASGFLLPPTTSLTSTPRGRIVGHDNHPLLSTIAPTERDDVMENKKNIETNLQSKKEKEQFNWFKSWHPIVPVEILDKNKPHKFQLLNMDIVVWYDGVIANEKDDSFGPIQKKKRGSKKYKRVEGEWRAFVDECPHRKVPLSEGRIEKDGSLLCSYHAWRFDAEGKLLDAPQCQSEVVLNQLKNNPKSRCNAFPTKIIDGVLWLWAETGDDARLESALTPVPHYQLPEGVNKDRVWYGPWNYRELPYGADFFIENVLDPAHVSVSHHNIVGSRYGDQRRGVRLTSEITKNGFAAVTNVPFAEGSANNTFTAPSTVAIETEFGNNGGLQTLELYVSPSRPGFSNHVGRMVIVKEKSGKMPSLLRAFTLPLPKWLNHVMASFFLNQDALFLHTQERYMAKTGDYASFANDDEKAPSSDYSKATVPIETDRAVLAFRTWLSSLAGGKIPYKYNPQMPEPNNEVVFDVWNSHTKHCAICQRALKNIKRARFASFLVATCLAVWRPSNQVVNMASVLASAGLGVALHKLAGLFYRYEFSHAHND